MYFCSLLYLLVPAEAICWLWDLEWVAVIDGKPATSEHIETKVANNINQVRLCSHRSGC